jgi:hypothetical protein
MEPSYPTTSPRGHREPPWSIHSTGPCPYPVALRRSMLSSPSPREGKREGEEGVADVEDVVEVTIVEEEDDDDSVEVIPMPESPPRRSAYKQTTRIRIGPWGRPTRILASRMSAGEASRESLETRSAVWPLPPPPPTSGAITTVERCLDHRKIPPPQMNRHHSRAPSRAESSAASPT